MRSGDIGSRDAQGRFYFHGRLENMIKRSGENVSGEEVEFTIMWHPAIEECAVFGVPDPIRTEEVCAVVVPRARPSLIAEEIWSFCTDQGLSDWKIPRYVIIQSEPLPKLANGKLRRSAVIEQTSLEATADRSASRISER